MDPGAPLSSSAGFWAARARPSPLTDWRNNARPPGGAFPYVRQHADTIAKATVDRVFAAVPGLNTNLRARFAGAPPPGSPWKPPPHIVPYQQAHKAALVAQRGCRTRRLRTRP
jgi:hypothetical protein